MGEIADFKNGVNYTKGETKYKYLCVGVTNFQESPILQDFDAISTVTLDNQLTEDFLLQEGDILLVRSNGNKRLIGRSMLIFPEDKVMTYSGFCIRCRITSPTVESKYIFYYLQNALIRGLFAKNQQTNINNISQEVLNNIMVFLPNVEIQRKISNLLFFIDSKIALNNRVNATLEAMAKTIYDYWFVQFDFPDEKGRPYKTSGGKMVYNEELGREIPAGWEVGNLNVIAEYINGLACQRFRPQENENALPVVKIREIHEGIQADTERVSVNIPEENIIEDGDILFSWSATLEVNYWIGGKAGLNQHIFKVQPKEGFNREYVYHQLREYVINFVKIAEARKTTMGHITQDHLNFSRIPIPPRPVLSSFQTQMRPLHEKMIQSKKENHRLAALRDWLLPMLMNGQVGFRKGYGGRII